MVFDADSIRWRDADFTRAPLKELAISFGLPALDDWPSIEWLNAQRPDDMTQRFVPQDEVDFGERYYEQIIAEQGIIPTRHNWHDLFNALMWVRFPHIKRMLNQQHMRDIEAYGVHPRSPRRHRLTHFDECGVVLPFCDATVPELLNAHQWHQAFYELKSQWGQCVDAWVIGHANYEMLLAPYIGLTGKWMGVEVPASFFEAGKEDQQQQLDEAVSSLLHQGNVLAERGALSPLPLLGVPGWYYDQSPTFYANERYFMPKRSK